MNRVERPEVLEHDLGGVGRPTAVVIGEAPRGDPMEPAAVHVHHEQGLVPTRRAVRVRPVEDDLLAVRGVVDREVVTTSDRGDPRQSLSIGGTDRVDAVQAWVGLPKALASEPLTVRGPDPAEGEQIGVGHGHIEVAARIGVDDERCAPRRAPARGDPASVWDQ